MKKLLVFASTLAIAATLIATQTSAVQMGGGSSQPWSKTCTGSVGGDGCTYTVTMTADTDETCPDDGYEYCVRLSLSCPSNGPEDPAQDCDSGEVCDVCGAGATIIALTCDGECYSAQPKSTSNWDGVASDCGNLSARDSGHPCQ